MDTTQIVGFSALGLLFSITSWLIIWCDYDDGIVGKIGLILISVGCLVRLIELSEGDPWEFSDVSVLVLGGMAIFMSRHLYRAWRHKRVAR